jgi:tetratricopeptide (TPR) repeat protein
MSRARALCLIVLMALVAAPRQARAQEEIFERGNQLYQQGDFAGAVEAYEAVRSAGFESADLHYNLGNAYFKSGELGRAILEWERALVLAPGTPDATANLELARSITADAVEPLPRFWLFAALSWWVRLVPRGLLIALVAGAWLVTCGGVVLRVWARSPDARRLATWLAAAAAAVVLVFGTNLGVRELRLGQPERGVILAASVPVRSAPAEQDDLTLFEIHEGTRVRIDQRTGEWAEVVLDDGKVGWVPAAVFEVI